MEEKPSRGALPFATGVLIAVYVLRPLVPGGPLRVLLGVWSPLLVAAICTAFERRNWRESLNLHAGKAWTYGVAVAGPTLVAGVTAAIGLWSGHGHWTGDSPSALAVASTAVMWIGGAAGEELGWRGYLHVRLRGRRLAPLWVGLAWSAWHLRTVIEKGEAPWQGAVFVALLLVTSFWLYWLVERSGSALPAVLFHGVWNTLRNTIGLDSHAAAPGRWLSSDAPALTDTEGAFGLAAMAALTLLALVVARRYGSLNVKAGLPEVP